MLKTIMELPTSQVFTYLNEQLKYGYKNIQTDGDNYIIFNGSNKIALVSHIDTLAKSPVQTKTKNNVMYNPAGILGADDRAGVYGMIKAACHAMKKQLPMPTLIFTNYEESGGVGVKKLIADKVLNVAGINLFVELDRKGCNEYVYYSYSLPKAVKKYVESYGYVQHEGSYSDIMDLTNEYEIPSVNLSCGYYSQHTDKEKLHIDELDFCVARVCRMLEKPIQELHKVEKLELSKWDRWEGNYGYYNGKETGYNPLLFGQSKSGKKKAKVYQFKPTKIEDLKAEIKKELLISGYIDGIYDLVDIDDQDNLYFLEDAFAEYTNLNPMELEECFEAAWDDMIKHKSADTIIDGGDEWGSYEINF